MDRARVAGGASLDASKTAFAMDFANRSALVALYPLSLDAAGYVTALVTAVQRNTNGNVDLNAQKSSLKTLYNTGSSQAQTRGLVSRAIRV